MALEQDSKVLQENSVLEAEKSLASEKMVRFKWYYRGSRFWICSMLSSYSLSTYAQRLKKSSNVSISSLLGPWGSEDASDRIERIALKWSAVFLNCS